MTLGGRAMLAAALSDALPAWQIVADARALDSVRKPAAAVLWTSKRTRPDKLTLDILQDEITLWVLTAADNPAIIENDLDELLEAVIQAIEPLEWCAWTEAERGTLDEKYPGWRLTVSCAYQLITEEP
ncbi:MAG: hypothetical protein QM582_14055 [Micropruina sp.]|uniref:hypothetical protein n=1 Tax=Micropruina sp. TaxID=2737536 RepID=UPI0039E49984